MDKKPMECGSMSMMMNNGSSAALCEPLEKLKREHVGLREKMEEFHTLAERVGREPDGGGALSRLRQLVADFSEQLEIHSQKEDDTLFPMMAGYIGREVGPIAVMEYEHEQARKQLSRFLESAEQEPTPDEGEEAKAAYAMEAYSLLSTHFTKEDNILFPMADKMLSAEEKERLNERIG